MNMVGTHVMQFYGSMRSAIVAAALVLVYVSCDIMYHPETEPPLEGTNGSVEAGVRVFSLNGIQQVCNPSISQDLSAFAGCMLWLNFSGMASVTIPSELDGYAGWSSQHDRLTIADTSNTVRWYMKREELGADDREEFQDPEWAAHPGYVVTLLSSGAMQRWSCYAIHLKTRMTIQLCKDSLFETSTPHLWVAPDAQAGSPPVDIHFDDEGFADSASVADFFGTTQVKLVFSTVSGSSMSLLYRDYASGGATVALQRPADREGWRCESPLISPEGHWIVFNAFETPRMYETYIQELSPESKPILFMSGASDPHWWIHPVDSSLIYIIYQEVAGTNLVNGDLADPELLKSSQLGTTSRQLVRLFRGAAVESVALSRIGQPEILVNLPTKGGLSPDGRYLCTGYSRAFMIGFA